MNTQQTPLVQKMILLMLVLIFGCLVIMMINGRKQIEALRDGDGQGVQLSSNTAPSIDRAFPKIRSFKPHPQNAVVAPEPPKADPAAAAQPTNTQAPVAAQPPAILPAAVIAPAEAVEPNTGVYGRVILVGTPRPEIPIRFDPTCGAMHTNPVTTRHFVVSPDGGLANVFVYISKGLEHRIFPTPVTPVLLDQRECMYQPYIIAAMVNQPIQLKNSDPILHNVHALPRVAGNTEFNLAQPLQNQTDVCKFSKPEVFVKLKCEVHDWMFAYVAVAANPYFAITDTNGSFELPSGLPPGRYELTATHLRAGSATQKFALKKNAAVELEFHLNADGKNQIANRQ